MTAILFSRVQWPMMMHDEAGIHLRDYLLAASSLWSVVRLCSCSTQQLVFQCIFQSRGWNATLGNDFICMVLARGCIRLCSSMHADEVKSMARCAFERLDNQKKICISDSDEAPISITQISSIRSALGGAWLQFTCFNDLQTGCVDSIIENVIKPCELLPVWQEC